MTSTARVVAALAMTTVLAVGVTPAHAACTTPQLTAAPTGATTSCSTSPASLATVVVQSGSVLVQIGCGGLVWASTNAGPGVTPLFFSPCTAATVYLTATSNNTTATATLT